MNKTTRQVMPIGLKNGSYELVTWIPRKRGIRKKNTMQKKD